MYSGSKKGPLPKSNNCDEDHEAAADGDDDKAKEHYRKLVKEPEEDVEEDVERNY